MEEEQKMQLGGIVRAPSYSTDSTSYPQRGKKERRKQANQLKQKIQQTRQQQNHKNPQNQAKTQRKNEPNTKKSLNICGEGVTGIASAQSML